MTREARFRSLYEEHAESVRRYLWRRDPELCEDALAETFLVAWRRLDELPDDPLPWLVGVARNTRLNLRRGARRRQSLVERLAAQPAPAADDGDGGPSERVRRALATLSDADREVLLLSVWEELDRPAIATALGCSKAAVAVRLHRARRRFAAALEVRDAPLARPRPLPGGAADDC